MTEKYGDKFEKISIMKSWKTVFFPREGKRRDLHVIYYIMPHRFSQLLFGENFREKKEDGKYKTDHSMCDRAHSGDAGRRLSFGHDHRSAIFCFSAAGRSSEEITMARNLSKYVNQMYKKFFYLFYLKNNQAQIFKPIQEEQT